MDPSSGLRQFPHSLFSIKLSVFGGGIKYGAASPDERVKQGVGPAGGVESLPSKILNAREVFGVQDFLGVDCTCGLDY